MPTPVGCVRDGPPAALVTRWARRRGGKTHAIEVRGCQEHRYTHAEFLERYRSAFGDAAPVTAAFGRS
jgi:hypothetical protein